MFESLGPAVPGSLVMEDRKADFLPYLSWEAQQSWISFPEGHPVLGGVLGCREHQLSSRSLAPAIGALLGWPGEMESHIPCPELRLQKQVPWGAWGIKPRSSWTQMPSCPGVVADKPSSSTGVSSH